MKSGRVEQLPPQAPLASPCPIREAVETLANAHSVDELGAVFTRPEVVSFILDLTGYTPDKPLYENRLLEPSFGNGDFLLPSVARLLNACQASGKPKSELLPMLKNAIRGVELHRDTFQTTHDKLGRQLDEAGLSPTERDSLLGAWLHQGDYLLTSFEGTFTHVVGNPPYVRQELIPDALIAEYRQRFTTIFDRADLYVPFIERSLRLLSPDGTLGFICADRWMKNRYGGPLRRLVAQEFHLRMIIDMVGTPAFHSDVTAYPAITIIANATPGATRVAYRPDILNASLDLLAGELTTGALGKNRTIKEMSIVGKGADPWLLGDSDHLALVARLEANYPPLEQAGCRVGIGVATGADKIFIGRHEELDIEPDRKLPLAMARDILDGTVKWRGYSVINPFSTEGGLVLLDAYPKLAKYLEAHKPALTKRHVAKNKAPGTWFRTIDKINPELAARPKLLIPDIKGDAHIVYEDGKLYPHHNLYYIISDEWDLRALQAVLLSGIARLFVSTYSTKMRGDYLRFQAQYLRRIRIPHWSAISDRTKTELIAAAGKDETACNKVVAKLYNLTKAEQTIIFGK